MSNLTRMQVLRHALPLVFANAAIPLAGVADTFVLGLTGSTADLAGVAAGAAVYSIFLHSASFLRMGTTGLVSQAFGAEDRAETQRIVARAIMLAAVLGLVMFALRYGIANLGFTVLGTTGDVNQKGEAYLVARAWGAPAAFGVFAITGWLIGAGRMVETLAVAALFSGTNIALDLVFVLGLDMGPAGVGAATALGDWIGFAGGVWFLWRTVGMSGGWEERVWQRQSLFHLPAIRQLFDVNVNLMIRTWALIAGFTYFVRAGASQGTVALAGNHILIQIISLWAFVLDAFAFVAEGETGRAYGRRSIADLRRGFRLTMELALAGGAVFTILTWVLGGPALTALIADLDAREAAMTFLPYCALAPLLGAPAWVLDGVFIGTTRGAMHRNASLIALVAYIAVDLVLAPRFGNHGVWIAFLCSYIARAGAMAAYYPRLEARIA